MEVATVASLVDTTLVLELATVPVLELDKMQDSEAHHMENEKPNNLTQKKDFDNVYIFSIKKYEIYKSVILPY